ncbi:hypothetical protein GUJ93_ZPchr0002g23176 [Zizania palustris]|uniref:C2H2-type domain-containing protein n=1 Tax=Zizania palustris TaxID=103762 RepID=A0A8J5S276_ZIZPA|nr:hypothetical protein GUJ93_ZPchr0002g23176 [Zizania palustris]
MACPSSPPPAAAPRPQQQQQQHDTTLRLSSLALPGSATTHLPLLPGPPYNTAAAAAALAVSPSPRPHARRTTRPEGSAALARVRCSPTGETPPCTECGKRFPSWKALFGHMRCHPERQWRGIMPPPPFQHEGGAAASQFTLQEREVAAILLMLSGARRPAAAVPPNPPSPNESFRAAGSSASAVTYDRCDDHKCTVCHRGFASGHKRCHWLGISVTASSTPEAASAPAPPNATMLDLNLPPRPLPRTKSNQGGVLNETTLDLKLGLNS